MNKLMIVLATGFGLGLSPIASGTVGCLLGLPIVYVLFGKLGLGIPAQIAIAAVLCLAAIPVSDVAEKALGGKKDDGRIVIDEYLTFPVCMIGLPAMNPVMLGTAFVMNRIFDILKPPPARGLQRLTGGLGITIDDVIASLYALAVNWMLYLWVLQPRGWVP
jgi:phosphatidylglycerophosphatase A